jgi:two-component system response regulator MprA
MLDPTLHAITGAAGQGHVSLTPTEYRLLAALAASPTRVVRRPALIAAAWPAGARVSDNTLDAYISKLRAKLRQAGRDEQISNARGVGYALR